MRFVQGLLSVATATTATGTSQLCSQQQAMLALVCVLWKAGVANRVSHHLLLKCVRAFSGCGVSCAGPAVARHHRAAAAACSTAGAARPHWKSHCQPADLSVRPPAQTAALATAAAPAAAKWAGPISPGASAVPQSQPAASSAAATLEQQLAAFFTAGQGVCSIAGSTGCSHQLWQHRSRPSCRHFRSRCRRWCCTA